MKTLLILCHHCCCRCRHYEESYTDYQNCYGNVLAGVLLIFLVVTVLILLLSIWYKKEER